VGRCQAWGLGVRRGDRILFATFDPMRVATFITFDARRHIWRPAAGSASKSCRGHTNNFKCVSGFTCALMVSKRLVSLSSSTREQVSIVFGGKHCNEQHGRMRPTSQQQSRDVQAARRAHNLELVRELREEL